MELILWGNAVEMTSSALARLAAEFPTVRITRGEGPPPADALRAACWEAADFDFWGFDRRLDALWEAALPLSLAGPGAELPRFAGEVLTRGQRLLDRRNAASETPLFDRVLARHRRLHGIDDRHRPLVRADYDHALDTWQWTLRLAPAAGLAVQLAALFHDVERLISEAEVRVEPRAGTVAAYQGFKDAHAARGAQLAEGFLAAAGVAPAVRRRAAAEIARHEGGPDPEDPERTLLADADALSFFSLNSPGFLRYYGAEPTRRKVAYTLGRMSPAARGRLAGLRLPPAVSEMVAAALAAEMVAEALAAEMVAEARA
jgi:uncharacterized protein DUF4202